MSTNPLNVLKRRLDDETLPFNKRLCLARNIVKINNLPTAPKEKIVAEWLEDAVSQNKLENDEFVKLLEWAISTEELTAELKSKLIQITSSFLKTNTLHEALLPVILSFIEDKKIVLQYNAHISEYVFIVKSILKHVKDNVATHKNTIERVFNGLITFYKDTKKKLEFIIKVLDGDNLETIFEYLDIPECKDLATNVCQSILFPASKKSFFVIFLRTLLQKENIDQLMEEKGDNIQSVLKVMSAFFTFPSGRTSKDHSFLRNFIQVFVTSFKSESQLIFAFYIMTGGSLNYDQSYMRPTMKLPPIIFKENDDKLKRELFLNMLQTLIDNEIDVNVRLTDTLGGSTTKVEIKKTFSAYLQSVMMGQLKLEGKPDKTSLRIIKTALMLDPTMIDKKLDVILPPLMVAKKGNSHESYIEMLSCLLEILFKLSRGTLFLNQMLPHLKLVLEAGNTEQFELQQTANEDSKSKNKIITAEDLFPKDCIELYGKLTSELMFRQNAELLQSLQKDFDVYCLMMLEEGFVSPSIITLSELLSAILSSFLRRTKMADQAVPAQIADAFWRAFESFENDALKRFGQCVLKLNYNQRLSKAFLELSTSVSQLKLLNIQYSNYKLDMSVDDASPVADMSVLLPCLNAEQWNGIAGKCESDSTVAGLWNNLLLLKLSATKLLSPNTENQDLETKNYLAKEYSSKPDYLTGNTLPQILLDDASQTKQLSKVLLKSIISNNDMDLLNNDAVANNKAFLTSLVLETLKNILKITDSSGKLTKSMGKSNFCLSTFLSENPEYFENLLQSRDKSQDDELIAYVDILKQLKICYLDENIQLAAIFVLLALKNTDLKKFRKNIDYILQSIFELTSKSPDLFKIFKIDYIFDFESKTLIDLLTLRIKTSNQHLILKSILEIAVKKVKTNAELIQIIVKILLTNQKVKKESTSIDFFNDEVFQISCLILPIIAKEKRAITASQYRSILAELQEKLHKALLKSFKTINFANEKEKMTGNTEDVNLENSIATLNAMEAFSLTLSKYCETTDAEEIQNLDCLWNGLEYFVRNAITSLSDRETKRQHVDSTLQLLNVTLRHIKKLESHPIFAQKDKILKDIWSSVKTRLLFTFEGNNYSCLDDLSVAVKFVSELSSVDCFVQSFVGDLFSLLTPKKQPKSKKEPDTTHQTQISHQVAKHLCNSCLKSNIVGPKCLAISKAVQRTIKNLCQWIRQNNEESNKEKIVFNDEICDILKNDLDVVSDVVLAAKKIPIDYKFMDSLFELQHMVQAILTTNTKDTRSNLSWDSYFKLYEGCVAILNSLVLSRDELLEDRWACYLQCYRSLVATLSQRSSAQNDLDRSTEDRLAELSHSIEKLTQQIAKKKAHISRLASYTVGDLCSSIELNAPSRAVRQHLENAVALLIQASDTSYSVAFLRRALAGSPGQVTMTNLYTMYKRYHKYVGNA